LFSWFAEILGIPPRRSDEARSVGSHVQAGEVRGVLDDARREAAPLDHHELRLRRLESQHLDVLEQLAALQERLRRLLARQAGFKGGRPPNPPELDLELEIVDDEDAEADRLVARLKSGR